METVINVKNGVETEAEITSEQRTVPPQRKSRKNWLYETLDLSRWVHHETVIRHLPFIFFLAGISILYIANTHYAEESIREISSIEKKLNELRWEYMSTKYELEYMRKQSEVAKRVAPFGLNELQEPPKKIVVKKDEQ
jgi:hypothetical protein